MSTTLNPSDKNAYGSDLVFVSFPLIDKLSVGSVPVFVNMSLWESIKIALANFRKHKVRTALSVLGVIIGILAVSLIVSLGRGVTGFVTSQMTAFGTDIIDISIKIPEKSTSGTMTSMAQGIEVTTLKRQDFEAMEEFDFVTAQTSYTSSQAWTNFGSQENQAFLFATTPDYIKIDQQAKLSKGRFFTKQEERAAAKVVILGAEAKKELFGKQNAPNKNIKIKGQNFRVIGVLQPRGQIAGFNMDDLAAVPLKTGQKTILGTNYVREGLLKIKPGTNMDVAVSRMEALLRRRHKITDPDKDDFMVMSIDRALETAHTVTRTLTLLLVFLAGISLFVGGIGIMSTMLVSVSERIREIGIRKAVGAQNKDILLQFLAESVILTFLGGVGGIAAAFFFTTVAAFIIQQLGFDWPISFSGLGFAVSLMVSAIVGIIFGIYPARKAAALDPITAIEQE